MKNPISEIFGKNIIIIILILIFGFFIITSFIKQVGIYEGMEEKEEKPSVQGKEIKVSTVYKF